MCLIIRHIFFFMGIAKGSNIFDPRILAEWTYRIDYVTKGTADAQFLSVLLHPNYSKRVC